MRKIWNRPNQQVWSLSTINEQSVGNMNICTYVTSVSMEPKLLMVAVYHGTQTLKNLTQTKRALLQLLSEELAPVTRICGHTSGSKINKIKRLEKRYAIENFNQLPFFSQCAGYLELELTKLIDVGGDHDLALCKVTHAKNISDKPLLTTDYLRASGFLR